MGGHGPIGNSPTGHLDTLAGVRGGEVETGKGADAMHRRPQLKAALAAARKRRCPRSRRETGPP